MPPLPPGILREIPCFQGDRASDPCNYIIIQKLFQNSRQQRRYGHLRGFYGVKCELETITLLACNATRGDAGNSYAEPFSIRPGVSNISSSQIDRLFVAKIERGFAALIDFQKNNLGALIAGVVLV